MNADDELVTTPDEPAETNYAEADAKYGVRGCGKAYGYGVEFNLQRNIVQIAGRVEKDPLWRKPAFGKGTSRWTMFVGVGRNDYWSSASIPTHPQRIVCVATKTIAWHIARFVRAGDVLVVSGTLMPIDGADGKMPVTGIMVEAASILDGAEKKVNSAHRRKKSREPLPQRNVGADLRVDFLE